MLRYFRFRTARICSQPSGWCLLFAVACSQPVQAQSFELNIDDWVRPRNGATVVEFAALRGAVAAWSAAGGHGVIEIRYPGGEEGGLWARELTDWLVAFGVPSRHIHVAPGSGRRDRMVLEVMASANPVADK